MFGKIANQSARADIEFRISRHRKIAVELIDVLREMELTDENDQLVGTVWDLISRLIAGYRGGDPEIDRLLAGWVY